MHIVSRLLARGFMHISWLTTLKSLWQFHYDHLCVDDFSLRLDRDECATIMVMMYNQAYHDLLHRLYHLVEGHFVSPMMDSWLPSNST